MLGAPSPRSGFVYLLALLVVVLVAGIAVVMGRGASVELRAQQAVMARSQCRAAAEGVLRAVAYDLAASLTAGNLPALITVDPAGEAVGDCTVVLVGRDPLGKRAVTGLRPWTAGLSVSVTAAAAALVGTELKNLPELTPAIAAAIADWQDDDDAVNPDGGAERTDVTYAGATVPYAPRNAQIETLEELRLVRDVDDARWFGEDRNANGRLDPGEDLDHDGVLDLGLRDLLVMEVREPATTFNGVSKAQIGIGVAAIAVAVFGTSRGGEIQKIIAAQFPGGPGTPNPSNRLDFLRLLRPNLSDAECGTLWPYLLERPIQLPNNQPSSNRYRFVDPWYTPESVLTAVTGADMAKAIISARPATAPTNPAWLIDAMVSVDPSLLATYGSRFTFGSFCFTADLLAVKNDGSGWVRLEATIDASNNGTVTILSQRDASAQGWPFPWATPDQVRTQAPANVGAFLLAGQP